MGFGAPIPDRSKYVQLGVESAVDPVVLKRIREEGVPFDRWANFRQRYHWKPVFMYGNEPASGVQIKYFNGEGDRLFPPLESERSEEHTSELQSRGHLVCRL